MGPEQGGATGTDGQDGLTRTGMTDTNSHDRRTEVQAIYDLLGTRRNPIIWPDRGSVPYSEYDTVHLQAMAFPTLFPFGVGDCTMFDRLKKVTMTESAKHLLKFCQKLNGEYVYRFARHPRWMHWAQNIAERHRAQGQRDMFIVRNREDTDLTERELREVIAEGGERLNRLVGKMCRFNANITGGASWFYQRRIELEALMEQEGMCTWWYTLSAADNHWYDLHRIINGDMPVPTFSNEKEKFQHRQKMVLKNQHIVDAYFCERLQFLMKSF